MREITLFLAMAFIAVMGYLTGLRDAEHQLKKAEHWGCEAPAYIGPTGGNHAVYQSEWRPERRMRITQPTQQE